MKHKLVHCTPERHAQAILDILNEAIVHTTALYDYQPRTQTQIQQWFASKQQGGYPVLGLEDDTGTLMGFASSGSFRNWPAYKYTVEHSVYVHKARRGHKLGHALMAALIEQARQQGLHMLVGVIDSANEGSKRFHTELGFAHSGTLRQAGFKFGRWLDIDFYQLMLDTPDHPVDG
ncbi:MAG: N-acetyltransferase family protein [Aquabacterium sp.]|uniref:GNAT family N-acetyltransferase n=1 Tax=Aquabacterium sp. TaxID=1872578 RepID=UPI00120C8A9A|nr:GNAT family N-acetyltransferase [Aquabacterium sp.]TAK91392.1 MAG: N-acetyltransferase family protein [Aquabacterium sp.]